MTAALSERTRRVLAALIREYIDTGEPVSSATLTESAGLGVSSATIRNILAQLEEMGYVMQPHTSAGRVPTDLGYRFYVDVLLEARRAKNSVSMVEARLRQDAGGLCSSSRSLPYSAYPISRRSESRAPRPAGRTRSDSPAARIARQTGAASSFATYSSKPSSPV